MIVLLLSTVLRPVLDHCKSRVLGIATGAEVKEEILEQNLPPFFSVLKKKQKDYWVKEEAFAKERLGMARMNNETFQKLNKEQPSRKGKPMLQGVHNYDILSNPLQCAKYQYIPCIFPQRYTYVISQYKEKELRKLSIDIVRLAIDLPYMEPNRAKELEFDCEYLAKEKRERKAADKEKQDDGNSKMDGIFAKLVQKSSIPT